MAFPQTRLTLIHRLAGGRDDRDWRDFLEDYWMPVCRFALRQGCGTVQDAEDVAAETFTALWHNQLLARWVMGRSAKLRTLMCRVVRNVLSNRVRVAQGRDRLVKEHGEELAGRPGLPVVESLDYPGEDVDAFYAAWADEIVGSASEALLAEYNRAGKGDYFRVLYGRICEEMTTPEIASALGISLTQAENYYKHARKRLTERLEESVRRHVEHYCPDADTQAEFTAEWAQLGDYLRDHGGLEDAIRRAYGDLPKPRETQTLRASMQTALRRMTMVRAAGD